MGYLPVNTVNRQQWEGAMSGGLPRPQGHPLGLCGEDMAMVHLHPAMVTRSVMVAGSIGIRELM